MSEYEATKLKQAVHLVLSDNSLLPGVDVTYCNLFVHRVSKLMGFDYFFNRQAERVMLANEIIAWLERNGRQLNTIEAFEAAKEGRFVIAGRRGDEHGHIAIIYPCPHLAYSGRWGMGVPLCANVGKVNGIFGVNWAFQILPEYYEVSAG